MSDIFENAMRDVKLSVLFTSPCGRMKVLVDVENRLTYFDRTDDVLDAEFRAFIKEYNENISNSDAIS